METDCKLGSPDKFENDSLMQSHSKMRERAWYCFGFNKEHDYKLGL